ncbi:MAG: HlyD family efflux transporter periplasmic adaptor subunit [Acidobacteria bacterium]|nr:HlyD family efflux transporter periplasmic adaptor subunit [Acidobacteriota bacterium]
MTFRKWLVLAVVVLVVAAGAYWILHSKSASANISDKDVITVQRVDFPLIVNATGTLEALRSVDVSPPQVGRERQFKLTRIAEEGAQVTEGDFLMEFDTSNISERLREEVANFQRVQENRQKQRSDRDIQLKNQRLTLEQAKTELEKLEIKMASQVDLVSGIEIEKTRIQRDAARRKVEFLEQELEYKEKSSQLNLQILRSNETHYRKRIDDLMDSMDSYTVRAPVAGVVIYKRDWNNEAVEVGDNVFMMNAVIEMPDLASIRARVQVDEVDSGKIGPEQEASISIDALRSQTFSGKVASVGTILKQASFDRPQKVCDVYVKIESENMKQLRPGMSLKAQIMVGRYSDVAVIPLSSIQERNGRSFVQVWKPEKKSFEWREVSLRTNDGINAVVESGLDGEEKIRIKPRV